MTQCFKEHECDKQLLNHNTKPFSECETHTVSAYDSTFECTDVPVLTCSGIWRVFQREAEEIVAPGILQPTIYEDQQLKLLLRGNHASYVTGFPSGVAQAIELTLASQCRPVEDGRTLEFSSNPFADLSDYNQRIAFVLRAAARFDEMLGDGNRRLLEQSIKDIAEGAGVR
jgi:hypothetical protein